MQGNVIFTGAKNFSRLYVVLRVFFKLKFVLYWCTPHMAPKYDVITCYVYVTKHSSKIGKYSNVLVKALVTEDILLRTNCCPWCFLGCPNWETFVADTKCFWTKSETFLVSRTQNLCCARGQTGKHLCRQQCVRNSVSSFARAFITTVCRHSPPSLLQGP